MSKDLISTKIDVRFGSVIFGKSMKVSTKKKLSKSQINLILPKTELILCKIGAQPLARGILSQPAFSTESLF